MATILKPGKGLFRLEGIYGVLWDGALHGPGEGGGGGGLESGNRLI